MSRVSVRRGVATHRGRVRDHNEDSVLAEGTVAVVADGMGGHAAGEVASAIVTETVAELLQPEVEGSPRRADVVAALERANERIRESARRHREQAGMGTTATGMALVADGDREQWAVFNVGDSRVYRLVAGALEQLTTDHSEVQEMVQAGVISQEEAAVHPLRNLITRSLGLDPMPEVDVRLLPAEPGERFLVCSDGLSNELSSDAMAAIVAGATGPQEAADALVRAAVEAGGRDNVTVVVLETEAGGDDRGSALD